MKAKHIADEVICILFYQVPILYDISQEYDPDVNVPAIKENFKTFRKHSQRI